MLGEACPGFCWRSIRATILTMTISPTAVRFDADTMWVDLSDGRTIGVPLGLLAGRRDVARQTTAV